MVQNNYNFLNLNKLNSPTQKVLITFFLLFLYRFCNTIPLGGIDQIALKQSFNQLEPNNSLMQVLTMYSGGGGNILLSPFSLGIIPFINASILIDLLTAIVPSLEKLQTEEGELGRKRIIFYKKLMTLVFSIGQSIFLLFYLQSYIYNSSFLNSFVIITQLSTGALLLVWLSNLIDLKGIGNGTSLIIFANIIGSLLNKNIQLSFPFGFEEYKEITLLLVVTLFICISQTARLNIDLVSARQLAFLQNVQNTFSEKFPTKFQGNGNGLAIRFNQAGIFPIIIASNILPFLSYFFTLFIPKVYLATLTTFFYYLLIIGFNYFYTIVFWDPEKIAEQLRKASVSLSNISPGYETVSHLENIVRSSSFLGGIFLCFILFSYDFVKQFMNGVLLNQINISSLIILVGVAFEIQRTLKSLYKSVIRNSI